MIKTEGTTIKCNRGDSGHLFIRKSDSDGNIEQFAVGDVVIFTIKNNFGEDTVILRKEKTVNEVCDSVQIDFSSEDTMIGELISEPIEYQYDVKVNGQSNNTILGYDDDGAKIFKLYPSGSVDV